MKNIAIIGGGASGLFCAIQLLSCENPPRVTIYEKMSRVGKKLLSTGNGRCNITNENAENLNHYYGENIDFARYSLSNFNPKALINYFNKNGLILRKEEDKYYPYSEQAGTVLDFLRFKCEMLGAVILTDTKVEKIEIEKDKFSVNNALFDKVVIAGGGKSSPHLGSDGSAYPLLEKFGHKKTRLYPAITQIKTDTEFVKQLKGIKFDSTLTVFVDNKPIRSEFGQVLFTDYGISGPPAFQLSAIAAKNYEKDCFVTLDFMSDKTFKEIESLINGILENPYTYPLTAEKLLSILINKRLGQIIVKYSGFSLGFDAYQLSKKDISTLINSIKNFKIKVKGVNGFNNAQITYGGISTRDFNAETLESKLKKGVYACGEILDVNGDCGGFNLQWAFSSAYTVAEAIKGEAND